MAWTNYLSCHQDHLRYKYKTSKYIKNTLLERLPFTNKISLNWYPSMTAAPKPPRNINSDTWQKTGTNGGEKLIRARAEVYFGVFCFFLSLCGELVQVIMAAAGEVGLQNFPKQIPLQQAVGHGQELLDNLVEILEGVRKPKINDFLTTLFAWPKAV